LKIILIACINGLKGFSEAIEAIFPKIRVQLSMRYVPEKDKKAVMAVYETYLRGK
jgi:putative transposase